MVSRLIDSFKNKIKSLAPASVLDMYMKLRLTPNKYQLFRINQYEKTYDGSIIKLGDYYYRLHQHESVSRMLYADRIFSADVVGFLMKLLPKVGSFIDVGANIGSITIPTMSRFPLPALAIEPVSENIKLLQENLKLNKLSSQVIILQAAIGDTNGTTEIYLSPTNSGDHRISRREYEARKYEEVALFTLDKCIQDFEHLKAPYLIKVDVQGYETYVLRGSQKLAQSPCTFVIELWPWGLETNGTSVAELEQTYKNLGLEAYVLRVHNEEVKLEYIDSLKAIGDEIPPTGGAHLEILITNQGLEELGLASFLIKE